LSNLNETLNSSNDKSTQGMLNAAAFAGLFGTTISDVVSKCGDLIESFDFQYEVLPKEEQDVVMASVIEAIEDGIFKVSGKVRKTDWENGWQENLDAFIASGCDISTLAPKYISKYPVSRLFSRYVKPRDTQFELNFYTVYRQYLFSTYLKPFKNIFEFGCGTGYNLAILNSLFPEKRLLGLDWAESSVKIANSLGAHLNAPLSGRQFDYFNPDFSLVIPESSVLITLNSLEQIGADHTEFLNFIIDKKPALCINAEPFVEMYDELNQVDALAILYHNKRNYLSGYYDSLKKLESECKIVIDKAQRIPFGNLYHEGYSYIVWRVIA